MQPSSMLKTRLASTLTGLRARQRQTALPAIKAAYATTSDSFPLYTPGFEAPPNPEPSILVPRNRKELVRQVKHLEAENREIKQDVAAVEKAEFSEEFTADLPAWEEADYQTFYTALIASAAADASTKGLSQLSAPTSLKSIGSPEERAEIIAGALTRIQRSQLGEQTEEDRVVDGNEADVTRIAEGLSMSTALVARIINIASAGPAGSQEESRQATLQPGILAPMEADALLEELVQQGEFESARRLLAVADGMLPGFSDGGHEYLLSSCSTRGDVAEVIRHVKEMANLGPVDPSHLHHLVVANVNAGKTHQAVRLLHSFEDRKNVLPITSYEVVVDALLSAPLTRSQADKALARDLFAHMRLVAHPIPSVPLYNSMIKSCADPADPQPERALDLMTELQQDSKLQPTGETYTAAILACSRVTDFYAEAFRLLSQMLELQESALAGGLSENMSTGFEPSIDTFNALLEGTKRAGDLSRARWIFSELLKLAENGGPKPVTETLASVFHTYAAFVPKVSRADVQQAASAGVDSSDPRSPSKPVDTHRAGTADQEALSDETSVAQTFAQHSDDLSKRTITLPTTLPAGPQSASEALQEAQRLYELVLEAQRADVGSSHIFSDVVVTSRLVNAYLSVHLAHDILTKSLDAWTTVWNDPRISALGLKRTGWSYLAMLEKIGFSSATAVTAVRSQLSDIWKGYIAWTEESEHGLKPKLSDERDRHLIGLGPRQVERCYAAGIRAHVLTDDLAGALALFKQFRDTYPARDILDTYTRPHRFGNMVRMSSAADVKEDGTPAHLLFHDVESLHQKLVIQGDLASVGYLKWACTAYQAALGKRRKLRIQEDAGPLKIGHLIKGPGKESRRRGIIKQSSPLQGVRRFGPMASHAEGRTTMHALGNIRAMSHTAFVRAFDGEAADNDLSIPSTSKAGAALAMKLAQRSLQPRPATGIAFAPPARPATQSPNSHTSARRLLHSSAPLSDNHFDTHHFVERLEAEGLTRVQAEGVMAALAEVIDESITGMSKSMVTKAEQEKLHYTQKVDFATLKSELQLHEKNDLTLMKTENDQLRADVEKLKQRLREEITRTMAGVRLDLNLEKGRIRDEASQQELKIKEVDTRIESEIAGLRTQIEQAKFSILQYLVGVATGAGALLLAYLRMFK